MYGKQIQTGLLWRRAPTAQSFLGLETAGGSKFCSPVEEGLGDVSRTTGQGDGRNESRTQAPHSQLYRIPVLFHKVAAPHLSPRVGSSPVPQGRKNGGKTQDRGGTSENTQSH